MQTLWIVAAAAVAGLLLAFYAISTYRRRKKALANEGSGTEGAAQSEVEDLTMELEDLHWLLDKKKADLQLLKTTQQLKEENAVKLDAIEDTVRVIEDRMTKLQTCLSDARRAAIAMDELSTSCQRLQNELEQNQQQLRSTLGEVESLRQQLDEATEYAAEMKAQKQQLQKKVKVLEGINESLKELSGALQ